MERSDTWTHAMRSAGMTTLGASGFPLAVLLVGVWTRSVPAAMQTALMGVVLLATAALGTLICMALASRDGHADQGLGWLGAAVISVLGQTVLAVFVGVVWGAMVSREPSLREPERGRPVGRPRFRARPRGE